MAGDGSKRIEQSLEKAARMSQVVYFILIALFLMSILAGILLIVPPLFSLQDVSLGAIVTYVPILVLWISTSLALWVLILLFGKLARGQSPLTRMSASSFRFLGVVYLVCVVVEAFVSPDIVAFFDAGNIDVALSLSAANRYPVISINAQLLIMGAIFLCLSWVLNYASLLQKLSDDTV